MQGLTWKDGVLPDHLYMFATIPEKKTEQVDLGDPSIEWTPLDEAQEHTKALMRWIYEYYVLHSADQQVTCYEQTVFFPSNTTFDPVPGNMWGAQVQAFDVWNQQEVLFLFRLA